jgi:hypothetical protein
LHQDAPDRLIAVRVEDVDLGPLTWSGVEGAESG